VRWILMVVAFIAGCGDAQPDVWMLDREVRDAAVEVRLEAGQDGWGGEAAQVADGFVVGEGGAPGLDAAPDAAEAATVDGPEPNGDAAAEQPVADAACWPPATCQPGQCACYRTYPMDAHCNYYDGRTAAWVCPDHCAMAGCAFEYDAQDDLACCPA
jgi:hypothetical protein